MRQLVGKLPVTERGHPEEPILESPQMFGKAEVQPTLRHQAFDAVRVRWEQDLNAEIFARQATGRNVDKSGGRLGLGAREGEQGAGEARYESQDTISLPAPRRCMQVTWYTGFSPRAGLRNLVQQQVPAPKQKQTRKNAEEAGFVERLRQQETLRVIR